MSQQYDNNMRGVLFENDRKETDNHPDYTGKCEVDGVEYWLSAWVKPGRNGDFFSLSFKPKEGEQRQQAPSSNRRPAQSARPTERLRQQQTPQRQSRPAQGFDDMDDDIPFN
jgi:single-stranded DNA-binding protein